MQRASIMSYGMLRHSTIMMKSGVIELEGTAKEVEDTTNIVDHYGLEPAKFWYFSYSKISNN